MQFIVDSLFHSFQQVITTLSSNWPYLLLSVVIAVVLKLYVNTGKVTAFLNRYRSAGVVAATAAAVGTPLCSCGTTAVVLGMMAGALPWAPIVAFMVASPLTSPEGLVYTAGLFGWPFSIAFFIASVLMGLFAGWITGILEKRGWLANQNRFTGAKQSVDSTAFIPLNQVSAPETYFVPMASVVAMQSLSGLQPAGSNRNLSASVSAFSREKWPMNLRKFTSEFLRLGSRLLAMFMGFAFIGYFLNGLIPSAWVSVLFGGQGIYSVPLAATLSLPFYINSEASLPLIHALLDNGMSQGAALAFLIAGSGTSIGAMTGALTIARWRVVALVIGFLWVGAVVSGFAYNMWLTR